MQSLSNIDLAALVQEIRQQARALGFQRIGISRPDLSNDAEYLRRWLARQHHGSMRWMAQHQDKREEPRALVPGTLRVISAAFNYAQGPSALAWSTLADDQRAYIARYALGRDYHRLMRRRLQTLAKTIADHIGFLGYRVFTDSAPVLERALARDAGIGWIGKHTCLIDKTRGSWFFLGEIYVDIPLPADPPATAHCGTCSRCMDICPTGAIIAPYQLDARRCIAYLTIEHEGSIPEEWRSAIGNRIFGCDDCQLICPWNKFAQRTDEPGFLPRSPFDSATLIALFDWDEEEFLRRTEGSTIRRTGYQRWLRNIAVALGNATTTPAIVTALIRRYHHDSAMVREHVQWALRQHGFQAKN